LQKVAVNDGLLRYHHAPRRAHVRFHDGARGFRVAGAQARDRLVRLQPADFRPGKVSVWRGLHALRKRGGCLLLYAPAAPRMW